MLLLRLLRPIRLFLQRRLQLFATTCAATTTATSTVVYDHRYFYDGYDQYYCSYYDNYNVCVEIFEHPMNT